jgi:hypothetical protein
VGTAREALEVGPRLALVGRLAEDVAVDGDDRVGPEESPWGRFLLEFGGRRGRGRLRGRAELPRMPARDGNGLTARVLLDDRARVAVRDLLDPAGADLEGDAGLGEDRPPLG